MKIKKFQEGGQLQQPVQEPASMPAQDPIIEIANLMAQGLQSGDCNMLAQACEAFLSLLQQAQAPTREPIREQYDSEPVFKKGGKLVKRKKCSK